LPSDKNYLKNVFTLNPYNGISAQTTA